MRRPLLPLLTVFMCHSSEDKELVRTLCGTLRNAGFDPWLDEERVMPGEDWQEKIDAALRSCGAVIVCLSERSVVKDDYVNKEIHRVTSKITSGGNGLNPDENSDETTLAVVGAA